MNAVLALSIALACGSPKIVNRTKSWNEQDKTTLETAQKRCGQIYPDSPCVKMFRKADEGIYSAICGERVKEWAI